MSLNYSFPATMLKAGNEKDGKIPIEIIPSEPTVDRVNDKIILKAFEDAREDFLDDGIIDYDHKSVLGKSELEKAQAIIGEPEDLFIDRKRKIPICHAFLFKGNPFVDTVILPAINNDSKIFGASVGGKVLLKSSEIDETTNKEINTISKILLKHIAITPRFKAVHPNTSLKLLKSQNDEDYNLYSKNFDDFLKSFDDNSLIKTLIAGSATNISDISGGQSIQNQSLEGSVINRNKIKNALPFILDNVLKGNGFLNHRDWMIYLMDKGFSAEEAKETIQLLIANKAKIIELI
jgi:hypothetical protein